jgi:hypothetical protein
MKGGEYMIRETAELTFSTTIGGYRVVRVPDPLATVSQTLLDISEDLIRQASPFDATIGGLVELKKAERVSVDSTSLIALA